MSVNEAMRARWRRGTISLSLSLAAAGALVLAHLAGAVTVTTALRIGAAVVVFPLLVSAPRALSASLPSPTEIGAGPDLSSTLTRLVAWAGGWRRSRLAGGTSEEEETAHLVRFGEISAIDFYVRLRPRLSAVLTRRLLLAGVDPTDLESVSRLLGPLATSILDPATQPPRDRAAPGVAVGDVARLLEQAEALT